MSDLNAAPTSHDVAGPQSHQVGSAIHGAGSTSADAGNQAAVSPVWVVMRARNDAAVIGQTLDALRRQSLAHRLLVMDNASTDATRTIAEAYGDKLLDVPAGTYVPGRVINRAMRETDGDVVVFLNSDCTPTDEHFLTRLVAAMADPTVAAAYGRQSARPDCSEIHALDLERAYGPHPKAEQMQHADEHTHAGEHRQPAAKRLAWRHFFSMAACAIRRSVWQRLAFREDLTYSEDIDWTWRVRQAGAQARAALGSSSTDSALGGCTRIVYVPSAHVLHSHDYTAAQMYRRHYGEGLAEAQIFDWTPWQRSVLRYTVLPLVKSVLRDVRDLSMRGCWRDVLRSPGLRAAAAIGRRRGFVAGWKNRSADGRSAMAAAPSAVAP